MKTPEQRDTIRLPCANCPWRVDAPRGHWDPQHFVDIWRNCQDDGTHEMRCHKSTPDCPRTCQGWVRVLGYESIGVRIAVMGGLVTGAEVGDRSGPILFRSFAQMMRANRIPIPPRNQLVSIYQQESCMPRRSSSVSGAFKRVLVALARHASSHPLDPGLTATQIGAIVWPGDRSGRVSASRGGGDYAAQMLLGRMRRRGLVRVRARTDDVTSVWEWTEEGKRWLDRRMK